MMHPEKSKYQDDLCYFLQPRVRCKNKKLQKILNKIFGYKKVWILKPTGFFIPTLSFEIELPVEESEIEGKVEI